MMKLLVIVLVCVASVVFSEEHSCGDLERIKVRSQWNKAYGHDAQRREEFGRLVWDYIFEHDPKSRELFTRVRGDNLYSAEFDAHMMRVFGGLDGCIALLNNEETLQSSLAHLNKQHASRGVTNENFMLFEEALDHALPRYIDFFDQDAWDDCFEVIANAIKPAA